MSLFSSFSLSPPSYTVFSPPTLSVGDDSFVLLVRSLVRPSAPAKGSQPTKKTTIKDETRSCPQNEALKLCSFLHSMNMGFNSTLSPLADCVSHRSSKMLTYSSTTNAASVAAAHLTSCDVFASWRQTIFSPLITAFSAHYINAEKFARSDKLLETLSSIFYDWKVFIHFLWMWDDIKLSIVIVFMSFRAAFSTSNAACCVLFLALPSSTTAQ